MEVTHIPDVETVHAIYADRVLSVVDMMQSSINQYEREAYATQLAALADEVMATGWSWNLCEGPDGTHGIEFVPINEAERKNVTYKPIEKMTDRELLRKFANEVCAYDRLRDEEIEFREDHPNRDAWDAEQERDYKDLVVQIRSQYGQLRKIIDHINKERR